MVDYETAPSTVLKGNTERQWCKRDQWRSASTWCHIHFEVQQTSVGFFPRLPPDRPIWVQRFTFRLSLLRGGVASFHSVARLRDLRRLSLSLCTSLWDTPVMKGVTWPDGMSTTARGQVYCSMRLRASRHHLVWRSLKICAIYYTKADTPRLVCADSSSCYHACWMLYLQSDKRSVSIRELGTSMWKC